MWYGKVWYYAQWFYAIAYRVSQSVAKFYVYRTIPHLYHTTPVPFYTLPYHVSQPVATFYVTHHTLPYHISTPIPYTIPMAYYAQRFYAIPYRVSQSVATFYIDTPYFIVPHNTIQCRIVPWFLHHAIPRFPASGNILCDNQPWVTTHTHSLFSPIFFLDYHQNYFNEVEWLNWLLLMIYTIDDEGLWQCHIAESWSTLL